MKGAHSSVLKMVVMCGFCDEVGIETKCHEAETLSDWGKRFNRQTDKILKIYILV